MTVVISGTNGIQNVLGSAAAPSNTNGSSTNTGVYFPTSTTLGIATAGTNAVYVDASQNVGIGTSSPSTYGKAGIVTSAGSGNGGPASAIANASLSLGGTASSGALAMGIDATGTYYAWIQATTTGNSPIYNLALNPSGGNLLVGTTSVLSNGRIVIGSPMASINGLTVQSTSTSGTATYAYFLYNGTGTGAIQSTGTLTTYGTTSDYRLKTVVGAVTDAGQRIDALQPIEYTWNSSGQRTRGFLAHQFQEVYADSVTGTKDAVDDNGNPEYQSMQAGTSEVIADLVAEIQSLRKRLTALEAV